MKKETKKVEKAPAKKVKKEVKSRQETDVLKAIQVVKKSIEDLNKKSRNLKNSKIGVFVDFLAFNNETKQALDGCSFGTGATVADEMRYIDSVRGARMLRITDTFIDQVSLDLKRRRGIIK